MGSATDVAKSSRASAAGSGQVRRQSGATENWCRRIVLNLDTLVDSPSRPFDWVSLLDREEKGFGWFCNVL